MRPDQPILRSQLLLLDRQCVITGEKQADVIDAAHIVPVKAGGKEVVSNAILLRADIHRLFDSGLVWFKTSGGRARVQYVSGLSVHYCDLLRDKSLPEATFRRVGKALQLRSALPTERVSGTPNLSLWPSYAPYPARSRRSSDSRFPPVAALKARGLATTAIVETGP